MGNKLKIIFLDFSKRAILLLLVFISIEGIYRYLSRFQTISELRILFGIFFYLIIAYNVSRFTLTCLRINKAKSSSDKKFSLTNLINNKRVIFLVVLLFFLLVSTLLFKIFNFRITIQSIINLYFDPSLIRQGSPLYYINLIRNLNYVIWTLNTWILPVGIFIVTSLLFMLLRKGLFKENSLFWMLKIFFFLVITIVFYHFISWYWLPGRKPVSYSELFGIIAYLILSIYALLIIILWLIWKVSKKIFFKILYQDFGVMFASGVLISIFFSSLANTNSLLRFEENFEKNNPKNLAVIKLDKSKMVNGSLNNNTGVIFETYFKELSSDISWYATKPYINADSKYWVVDFKTGSISPIDLTHKFFTKVYDYQMNSTTQTNTKRITSPCRNCTQLDTIPDYQNPDIVLMTTVPTISPDFTKIYNKNNNPPESAWIGNKKTGETKKIIDDLSLQPCKGNISFWNENQSELIFIQNYYKDSEAYIKYICIYNYKNKKHIYSKNFGLKNINITDVNFNDGYYLSSDTDSFTLVNYREQQERQLFPDVSKSRFYYGEYNLLGENRNKLFQYGLIVFKFEKPDGSQTLGMYDYIKDKRILLTDLPGKNDVFWKYGDGIVFTSYGTSPDGKYLLLYVPYSWPEMDKVKWINICWYLYDLESSKLKSWVCQESFRKQYPYPLSVATAETIHVTPIGWY